MTIGGVPTREYTDAQGCKWIVRLTAHALRMAMREMGADFNTCLLTRGEEFILTLFWFCIAEQAQRNRVTRDEIEQDHVRVSDLSSKTPGSLQGVFEGLFNEAFHSDASEVEADTTGESPAKG